MIIVLDVVAAGGASFNLDEYPTMLLAVNVASAVPRVSFIQLHNLQWPISSLTFDEKSQQIIAVGIAPAGKDNQFQVATINPVSGFVKPLLALPNAGMYMLVAFVTFRTLCGLLVDHF